MAVRDRHLWGAGAAACAVCCAAPVLGLLGLAGAGLAATVATIAFAGIVFGAVVGLAAAAATVLRKRRRDKTATLCRAAELGPIELTRSATRRLDSP
jgi:hypothetical protein